MFAKLDNQNTLLTIANSWSRVIFEETWSFIVLFIIANKLYLSNKNYNISFWIASIISALLFKIGHILIYYDGGDISAIIFSISFHGLYRVILNTSGLTSNTIILPYIIHLFSSLLILILTLQYI